MSHMKMLKDNAEAMAESVCRAYIREVRHTVNHGGITDQTTTADVVRAALEALPRQYAANLNEVSRIRRPA